MLPLVVDLFLSAWLLLVSHQLLWIGTQACKLAPVIRHLSSKFEGMYHSLFTLCPTEQAAGQVKPCPWPDIWQAYREKLFAGLGTWVFHWHPHQCDTCKVVDCERVTLAATSLCLDVHVWHNSLGHLILSSSCWWVKWLLFVSFFRQMRVT